MSGRKGSLLVLVAALGFLLAGIPSLAQPLQGVRICIDAGHGGHEGDDRQIFLPNGIVYWESEGDLTTAFHLQELLESLGATVKLTRTDNSDDSDIPLSQRAAIANAFGADFFHSIHTNGGGGNYSLVLYKETNGAPAFPNALEMGSIMAPNLQDLMKTTANYVRGDYSFLGFNLGVLNYANMPSTLSESSFHDLPEEGLRLKNSEYLKNYAWAIAKSFLNYFEVDGFPTGRVGGVIRDITTGDVVNGVTVDCVPVGKSYTGDQNYNGFYAIGELDPGAYSLILSKDGYLNDTTAIGITANEYLDLDLTIQYFNNGFPNVDFYMTGLPAGAGEPIGFYANTSTDDGDIVHFAWDFGDGSPGTSGIQTSHSFSMDGNFEVTLTATDNDGNASSISKWVSIETRPPTTPRLLLISQNNNHKGLEIRWYKSPESNIQAYHIYASEDPDFSNPWLLTSTGPQMSHYSLDSFGLPGKSYYFRLTAENILFQESPPGDTYAMHLPADEEWVQNLLIVDGFNRNGSYSGASHSFVNTYLKALQPFNGFRVASCSNSAVAGDLLNLDDYAIVFWFLGDESTANETFSTNEQARVSAYLEQGGKLFVTGSEIGWDLYDKGSAADRNFYRKYLKAEYLADGGPGRSPATGLPDSGFETMILHFGQVYPEDYPDEIGAVDGAEPILEYLTGAGAGIKYRGYFDDGEIEGALVYIGFPLESVGDEQEIRLFIEKVILFFNALPSNQVDPEDFSRVFELYPTVIDKSLTIYTDLTQKTDLQLQVLNSYGLSFVMESFPVLAGRNQLSIPAAHWPSGVYFLVIRSAGFNHTLRFVKR